MKISRSRLRRLIYESVLLKEDQLLEEEDIRSLVDQLTNTLKISYPDAVNRKVGFPTTGDNLDAANGILEPFQSNATVLNQIGMEFNRRSGFNKKQDPRLSLPALIDRMLDSPMIKKNKYKLEDYPAVKALYNANN